MKKYSKNIKTEDVLLLFSRFDKDGNRFISFTEFDYEMTPKL